MGNGVGWGEACDKGVGANLGGGQKDVTRGRGGGANQSTPGIIIRICERKYASSPSRTSQVYNAIRQKIVHSTCELSIAKHKHIKQLSEIRQYVLRK